MGRLAAAQLGLPFRAAWGGKRRGAGRKPATGRRSTAHVARAEHRASEPVHVVLRARFRPLRSQFVFPTVRRAITRASHRSPDFRVVHFSVQQDHVHLIVEARDKRALSAGMRGLAIRIARQVNALVFRRGPLWADRWYGRALSSRREVRQALAYVLHNFKKHGCRSNRRVDPYSSAPYFDGFSEYAGVLPWLASPAMIPRALAPPAQTPVAAARTWLLSKGWRCHGAISIHESPVTSNPRQPAGARRR